MKEHTIHWYSPTIFRHLCQGNEKKNRGAEKIRYLHEKPIFSSLTTPKPRALSISTASSSESRKVTRVCIPRYSRDEAWVFIGTDQANPHELGEELDFYLDDEQYIIDNSCIVFLSAGLRHGPRSVRRINRALSLMTMCNSTEYMRESGNEI